MHHEHPEPPTRRTFLDWAVHGLGAVFAVVFGFPVVSYLIDPRNRPRPPGDFRPVSGIKTSEWRVDVPVQGTIRAVRYDSWTLYPNDVIGRVFVVRIREGNDKACFQVFSTKCPHLGCSINSNVSGEAPARGAAAVAFICPCHNGQFLMNGDRRPNDADYTNPSPRGMYELEFELAADPANPDENNRDLLKVKYVLPSSARADAPAKA